MITLLDGYLDSRIVCADTVRIAVLKFDCDFKFKICFDAVEMDLGILEEIYDKVRDDQGIKKSVLQLRKDVMIKQAIKILNTDLPAIPLEWDHLAIVTAAMKLEL